MSDIQIKRGMVIMLSIAVTASTLLAIVAGNLI